jgi:hypothetical protein
MYSVLKKSQLLLLVLLAMVFFFDANPAQAWYMELTDVVGDIEVGTWYTQQINFHSDTGTDRLEDHFISVDYDETKVELAGVQFEDYWDDAEPFPNQIWDGGMLPYFDEDGKVTDLMGSEPLGYQHHFFPEAGDTLMATLYWDPLVTDEDVTVSEWTNGPNTDFITVYDINYCYPPDTMIPGEPAPGLLTQYRDLGANTDNLAPVPVPAAVWLLGSGLLGLIGIRRRKN